MKTITLGLITCIYLLCNINVCIASQDTLNDLSRISTNKIKLNIILSTAPGMGFGSVIGGTTTFIKFKNSLDVCTGISKNNFFFGIGIGVDRRKSEDGILNSLPVFAEIVLPAFNKIKQSGLGSKNIKNKTISIDFTFGKSINSSSQEQEGVIPTWNTSLNLLWNISNVKHRMTIGPGISIQSYQVTYKWDGNKVFEEGATVFHVKFQYYFGSVKYMS